MDKDFGTWLKQKRLEKGLQQKELADKLKIPFSQQIAMIESNKINFPLDKVSLLSKALGVDKNELFRLVEECQIQKLKKKIQKQMK